jgi:Fic family protein
MVSEIELYTSPSSMTPLLPEDGTGLLENLAVKLVKKSSMLSATLNPITSSAISDFLRPMNSYYSNLIEGHDTHPIDIDKALKKVFSDDSTKRNLQEEARAHIEVHKDISNLIKLESSDIAPSSFLFIKDIHEKFYRHLPEDFKKTETKEGTIIDIIPGEIRKTEVEVGKHIGPDSKHIDSFISVFENTYNTDNINKKTSKIIAIAASHHRLAWIHPFVDGNGRVVRLYSDACFMHEDLDSSGLWSISRGLSRTEETYKSMLANADLKRRGDRDGRGNLSNKMLVEFCKYFLETAIDQIEYMYSVINEKEMLERIEDFCNLMVVKKKLRSEAKYVLKDIFLKGKITKADAMRITGSTDKTAKILTDEIEALGLLSSKLVGKEMTYFAKYPIEYSPSLFPGLYPTAKEIDMIAKN